MRKSHKGTFDTTPEPRFLRGQQNVPWTIVGAMKECLDNSWGVGRGNANRVEMSYDKKTRQLSILDNGQGMEKVGHLFRLGATIGRTPNDIGEYGNGGTLAILWLFSRVDVWSLKNGKVSHVAMRWSDYFSSSDFPAVEDRWQTASLVNTPSRLLEFGHGTLIKGTLLYERGAFNAANTTRALAMAYAPATRAGKELVWIGDDGEENYLSNPFPKFKAGQSEVIDMLLCPDDEIFLPVHGEIGIVDDLPLSASKIHVGFGNRVIMQTRDFFESVDGGERFNVSGVTGWIDLGDGWQPYLSTTKDSINDTPLYEKLREKIFEKIKPILQKVKTEKLKILLKGLALELNGALDPDQCTQIRVRPSGEETPERPEPDPEREIKTRKKHRRFPKPLPEDSSGVLKKQPVRTRLELSPLNDQEMEFRLCDAQRQGERVVIFINEDHPDVKVSMEQKPINRVALAFLALRELARLLKQEKDLQEKVFNIRDFHKIEHVSEEIREGLIFRMLIDKVVSKAA